MFNSIKADFYRLFRSRGFIINQILLITVLVLSILGKAVGNNGVHPNVQDQMISTVWTSDFASQIVSSMTSFLLYFGLPLLVIIVGYDLTHKTYKNILTNGISRLNYFTSKYFILLLALASQVIFFYATTILTTGILYGFGKLNSEFWQNLSRTMLLQYLCIIAIFSIAIIVLFLTNSNVGAVIATITIPIAISIAHVFIELSFLKHFDFQANMDGAWYIQATSSEYTSYLLAAFVTSLIAYCIAYSIFKKKAL